MDHSTFGVLHKSAETKLCDVSTDHQTKCLRPRMSSEEIRRMSHETLGSGAEVWLREIALQLAALNDRADADAKVFNEMVAKGNGLSA